MTSSLNPMLEGALQNAFDWIRGTTEKYRKFNQLDTRKQATQIFVCLDLDTIRQIDEMQEVALKLIASLAGNRKPLSRKFSMIKSELDYRIRRLKIFRDNVPLSEYRELAVQILERNALRKKETESEPLYVARQANSLQAVNLFATKWRFEETPEFMNRIRALNRLMIASPQRQVVLFWQQSQHIELPSQEFQQLLQGIKCRPEAPSKNLEFAKELAGFKAWLNSQTLEAIEKVLHEAATLKERGAKLVSEDTGAIIDHAVEQWSHKQQETLIDSVWPPAENRVVESCHRVVLDPLAVNRRGALKPDVPPELSGLASLLDLKDPQQWLLVAMGAAEVMSASSLHKETIRLMLARWVREVFAPLQEQEFFSEMRQIGVAVGEAIDELAEHRAGLLLLILETIRNMNPSSTLISQEFDQINREIISKMEVQKKQKDEEDWYTVSNDQFSYLPPP